MPRKDLTGPEGKGPKRVNQGVPTPRRDGSGGGTGRGRGTGRGGNRSGGRGRR
jgi:hypothetical protein